jgi:hypothetical protein
MTESVIITRHQALVEVIHELYPDTNNCAVVAQASPADIEGKVVYGVLPPQLAKLAEHVVAIPLAVPAELRGVELTKEQVKALMGKPFPYKVIEL